MNLYTSYTTQRQSLSLLRAVEVPCREEIQEDFARRVDILDKN
jgi:hypothetical protein